MVKIKLLWTVLIWNLCILAATIYLMMNISGWCIFLMCLIDSDLYVEVKK